MTLPEGFRGQDSAAAPSVLSNQQGVDHQITVAALYPCRDNGVVLLAACRSLSHTQGPVTMFFQRTHPATLWPSNWHPLLPSHLHGCIDAAAPCHHPPACHHPPPSHHRPPCLRHHGIISPPSCWVELLLRSHSPSLPLYVPPHARHGTASPRHHRPPRQNQTVRSSCCYALLPSPPLPPRSHSTLAPGDPLSPLPCW